MAKIDEYKLNQVFNNLISNAIKFTHNGGLVTIPIDDRKETILMEVADMVLGYLPGIMSIFLKNLPEPKGWD